MSHNRRSTVSEVRTQCNGLKFKLKCKMIIRKKWLIIKRKFYDSGNYYYPENGVLSFAGWVLGNYLSEKL